MRINERAEVIIPTRGFRALNNSPGVNQMPRLSLNVSLGSRTVQYTPGMTIFSVGLGARGDLPLMRGKF